MRLYLFLIFVSISVFSQKKEIEEGFIISTSGKPQQIEVFKFRDNSFKGYFITTLNRKRFFKKEEVYIDTINIPDNDTKEIFLRLKELRINKLYDCNIKNDCFQGLDGDHTLISIISENKKNEFAFWELRPNLKKQDNINSNRFNAQRIINYLDQRYNFERQFQTLTKRLPKGKYSYFTSYFVVSFRK